MTWRAEVAGPTALIAECLQARELWRLLTAKQRAAILAAYPDSRVVAHPLTLNALERHGLMTGEPKLTEAGRLVAKWNRGADVTDEWLGHRDLCPLQWGRPCTCPCAAAGCPGIDRCKGGCPLSKAFTTDEEPQDT
jgi:hypothetical protein